MTTPFCAGMATRGWIVLHQPALARVRARITRLFHRIA